MGARLRAKHLASDLDLISSSGSLQAQPGISGLGQERSATAGSFGQAEDHPGAMIIRILRLGRPERSRIEASDIDGNLAALE